MKATNVAPPQTYRFPYYCIRKVSAPEDLENERKVYTGQAPAKSFLEIKDNENVREYLLEAPGRKRRKPTAVLRAIRETLDERPHEFSILNGGITILARSVEVDEKNRIACLDGASIINGSQTQGELKAYFERCNEQDVSPFPVHVSFELIETKDDDLVAEISIARNFMNNVLTISIVGRRGQLQELDEHFKQAKPGAKLRQSETDLSEQHINTEKLLQVIAALIPAELWPNRSEADNPKKVHTYSAKARCLKDFEAIYDEVKGSPRARNEVKELYQFYLDICGEAWDLYETWKQHRGFHGTGLRAIKRDKSGNIVEIPDGIVFPILAALSAFAVKQNSRWTIKPPASFSEEELIKAAKQVYMEIANSSPHTMGRSQACYSQLYQITSIYRKLSNV